MKRLIYKNQQKNEISFPLGGIGSGCIGLSGTGRLIDWEIFNRPNKGSMNGYSHFGIKVEDEEKVIDARVLNSDIAPPYNGEYAGSHFNSFGFGTHRYTMAGVPHFKDLNFQGNFPIAKLDFLDSEFPADVNMEAFNPFIPLDDKNSSIPAAFFSFKIRNTTDRLLKYTIEGSLSVPNIEGEWSNKYEEKEKMVYITTEQNKFDSNSTKYGNITLTAMPGDGEIAYQEYWYRGNWFDGLEMFWRDFTTVGCLENRKYEEKNKTREVDNFTLSISKTIPPCEEAEFRFIISWSFPNCENYWSSKTCCEGDACCEDEKNSHTWKNYYSTIFFDSVESATYSILNWESLYERTVMFTETLYSSSLPEPILDAIGANLSTLKSPTCLRLTDGSFYGFEGCHCDSGCCEGSCTHVWNYAYALPYLFPKLERSMRSLDFKFNQRNDGRMSFRLQLPIGSERTEFRACVDGQMGGVIKAYREWKISGDDSWLKSHWNEIVKSIEFAWADTNEDKWDPEKNGVITGRQHHTLDMELFGPNSWLNGFYLGALKAGAEMARYLKEHERAMEYEKIYENGKRWTEENLYNGKYYIQKINLNEKKILEPFVEGNKSLNEEGIYEAYWDETKNEIKYQIGDGCFIDQVIVQWHANLIGLGEIYDREKVKSALKNIYNNNYKKSVRKHFNPCRLFCLNDESGTVICEWPEDSYKPFSPVPYSEETMHGFEYQVAIHMIQEGMYEEGLNVVKAIRDRYDGVRRNPWNEIECGSNYARSMASYALNLVYSGFKIDMVKRRISFNPIVIKSDYLSYDSNLIKNNHSGYYKYFWSCDGAWGRFDLRKNSTNIIVKEGKLEIKEIELPYLSSKQINSVTINDKEYDFEKRSSSIVFMKGVNCEKGEEIKVKYQMD